MDNKEIRLEILRIVVENGSENKKVIPCQSAMNIINGFVRRMKIRLTKERQFVRTFLTTRNRLVV